MGWWQKTGEKVILLFEANVLRVRVNLDLAHIE